MPADPELKAKVEELIAENPVLLFMKGTPDAPRCGFSMRVTQVLQALDGHHPRVLHPRRAGRSPLGAHAMAGEKTAGAFERDQSLDEQLDLLQLPTVGPRIAAIEQLEIGAEGQKSCADERRKAARKFLSQ